MASVTLDKVADFDTQSQFQVDTWERSRDIRTDVPTEEKVRRRWCLNFWSTTEMVINNSNPKFRRKGTQHQNGRGRLPCLGGWIRLSAWGAFWESRSGARTRRISSKTNVCPSLSPWGGSWPLLVLIHWCTRSTCYKAGTAVTRLGLQKLQVSRGCIQRFGCSCGRCGALLRKGNLLSPGRSGEPSPRKEKQEFIS